MAAGTFVPFVAFFSCLWIFVLAGGVTQELTVKPGQDVVLNCRARNEWRSEARVATLMWKRTDLEEDHFVIFVNSRTLYEEYQDPSFHGRVEPIDREIRNGQATVILKNVTVNDTGTYKCLVYFFVICAQYPTDPILFNTINLKVEDSGHTAGTTKEGGDEEGGDKEGGNRNKVNKDEATKDAGNTHGGNKDGANKDDGNTHGGNKDGANKDEGITRQRNKDRGHKNDGGKKDEANSERITADVNSGGHVGLLVGLSLGVLVVLVVVTVVFVHFKICRKYKVLTDNNS